MRELFTFPERSRRDRVIELLETAKPETVRRVLRLVAVDAEGSVAPAVADDHPACRPVVVQAIP